MAAGLARVLGLDDLCISRRGPLFGVHGRVSALAPVSRSPLISASAGAIWRHDRLALEPQAASA